MRTRIVADGAHHVKMYHDDDEGQRQVTTFWAPGGGGYVRDVSVQPGTLGPQVCRGLADRGDTLHWSPDSGPALVTLIRREYRRGREEESR